MLDITIDPEAEEIGLASMLADLIRQNIDRCPARRRDFYALRGTVGIEARDAEVAVTLDFRAGTLSIHAGVSGRPDLIVSTDAATILDLSATRLRWGVPDIFDPSGREVLGRVVSGSLALRGSGLLRRPMLLVRLTRLLSVSEADQSPQPVLAGGLVLTGVLLYALIRYVLFQGVSPGHVPLYVVNKAVAVTALFLIGVAVAARSAEARHRYGMAGLGTAILHLMLAQAVVRPAYLPKLFLASDGSTGFTPAAGIALLLGALGLTGLLSAAWSRRSGAASDRSGSGRSSGRVAVACTAAHCLFLGWSGWWRPAGWPGGLPPITLLSFLFACGVMVVVLRRGQDQAGPGDNS